MIALQKQQLMLDVYAAQICARMNKKSKSDIAVKVGSSRSASPKIGLARRTAIGHRSNYIVSVGADGMPLPVTDKSVTDVKQSAKLTEKDLPAFNNASESRQLSATIIGSVGKTAGIVVAGTLVVGPPVIGYLLFSGVGLAVGSMVAAPFVLVFIWSIFS